MKKVQLLNKDSCKNCSQLQVFTKPQVIQGKKYNLITRNCRCLGEQISETLARPEKCVDEITAYTLQETQGIFQRFRNSEAVKKCIAGIEEEIEAVREGMTAKDLKNDNFPEEWYAIHNKLNDICSSRKFLEKFWVFEELEECVRVYGFADEENADIINCCNG